MGKLNLVKSSLGGFMVIEPTVFADARGYFVETYNERDLSEIGITTKFVQDNESKSSKGVLRGLHFQTRQAQDKLVRVIQGEVLDVAVDLRAGSPSFGQWDSAILSGENKRMAFVPRGFAHGFVVRSETAVFAYKCSDYYDPTSEAGIMWNDETIAVDWQLEGIEPLLSQKDTAQPTFLEAQQRGLISK